MLVNHEKYKEQGECVSCFDKKREIKFKPCGHIAVCKACYNQLQNKKCPICNASIQDTIDIYFG